MALLEVRDLKVDFVRRGERPFTAVDGISFDVEPGQTVGLVGESGCGKSVTSLAIMRLLARRGNKVSGSVRFEGTDLLKLSDKDMRDRRGRDLGMVFQDPLSSLNPVIPIGLQITEVLERHRGMSRKAATVEATDLLDKVGIPDPSRRLSEYPHQLSGGMRQRAMIAMALLNEPRVLIADEPTTALDVSIQAQILDLLDDLKARLGMGVILVTHDLGVIAGHADRVAVMYGGQIVEEAPTSTLFADPRHRYTQALFESMPTMELDSRHALASIPGVPPQLIDLPPMCRFSPRCRFADETCRTQDPELIAVAPAHTHSCFHPRPTGPDDETADHAFTVLSDEEVNASGGSGAALASLGAGEKLYRIKNPAPFKPHRVLHAVSGVTLDVLEGET